MDTFARLIPDARAFLNELSAHNSRDWFTGQKSRYDADLKTPATLLLDQVSHDIARDTGLTLTPKLFRPHRDVRFSKDKTPYHTHLHMLWAIDLPGRQKPALFFGISPDYVSFGGGVMQFEKPVLAEWRAAVDGVFGDELQQLLTDLAAHGLRPRDPDLKRVPAPYGTDHRHADLLRRKGLALWRDLQPAEFAAPLATLTTGFEQLRPLLDRLRTIL